MVPLARSAGLLGAREIKAMTELEPEFDEFAQFARRHCSAGVTIDELYDRWRSQVFRDNDASAVMASMRDLEAGERGKSLDEFLSEFELRASL